MKLSRLKNNLLVEAYAEKKETHYEIVLLFLIVVVCFSSFKYVYDLIRFAFECKFIDYAHYYTYAKIVSLGLDPFNTEDIRYVDYLLNIRRAGSAANYPPIFYLFMQPWLILPFRPSAVVWHVFNQILLLLCFWNWFRRFSNASLIRKALVVFIVFNYQPLIESLVLGQVDILLLFLMSVTWYLLTQEKIILPAIAAAAAVHIKIQYGLMIPVLFWTGNLKTGCWAFFFAGIGTVIGLAALGIKHYLMYLKYLISMPDYIHSWSVNISIRAIFLKLFGLGSSGQLLSLILTLSFDLIFLFIILKAKRNAEVEKNTERDISWSIGLAAIMLLSPFTTEHHLVALILPITVLILNKQNHISVYNNLFLLVGTILLLGSRLSLERFPYFHNGLPSLLNTGKTVGVLCLTLILVRSFKKAEIR